MYINVIFRENTMIIYVSINSIPTYLEQEFLTKDVCTLAVWEEIKGGAKKYHNRKQ